MLSENLKPVPSFPEHMDKQSLHLERYEQKATKLSVEKFDKQFILLMGDK